MFALCMNENGNWQMEDDVKAMNESLVHEIGKTIPYRRDSRLIAAYISKPTSKIVNAPSAVSLKPVMPVARVVLHGRRGASSLITINYNT